MARKVAVLVEDLYQDLEVWYPYLRLKEEGFEVLTVGTGKGEYKSKHGYPVTEDMPVDQARAADFGAVIIPGGTPRISSSLFRSLSPSAIVLTDKSNSVGMG